MSRIIIVLISLAASWAIHANSVIAQPFANPAKADKMVRVTYPVADLIVPISGYPGADSRDSLAKTLINVITTTVAPESWKDAGGTGTIQFFPLGMAIVVHQREDVHADVVRLLAELRRHADVQVSVETRFVHVSASMAKHLLLDMDEHGRLVRSDRRSPERVASLDEKQTAALLKLAQSDDASEITQAPKVTLFNAQQARLDCTQSMKTGIASGFACDITPVLDAERFVRLTLNLQHYTPAQPKPHVTKASRTFVLSPGRTLVWHLGETTENRHLFVLATPRVVRIAEERDAAEEQSLPAPKQQGNAKERAIEYRLKQPISLSFNKTPLRDAATAISITSGIQIVLDQRALREANIDYDAPLSGSADNLNMKYALNILLAPLRLTYVIENETLKITTDPRHCRLIRTTYPVADLVVPIPAVAGHEPGKTVEDELKALIMSTIAKESWEDMGGRGSFQYFPAAKAFVISQTEEIHEDIQLLLATLRRLQELMVNVEVQYVHCSAGSAKVLTNEMAKQGATVAAQPTREAQDGPIVNRRRSDLQRAVPTPKEWAFYVAMDDAGVQRFLKAAQTKTVSAPKINVYNGQRLAMDCLQKQVTEFRVPVNEPLVIPAGGPQSEGTVQSKKEKLTSGWRYDVQPIVTPDRRAVRLNLSFEHFANDEAVERITKAAATFTIEDQRTLVWHLGESGGEHLFVLVTPRVIVRQQEEENIFLGNIQPIPGR